MCKLLKRSNLISEKMYKYYSCGGDNSDRIESRLLGEIYFSSPLDFNDPYDCQLPIINNNTDSHPKGKSYIKFILEEENFPFDEVYNKLLKKDKETESKVFKEQINRLGILCLTKRNDNILMWGHYANNVGICLEYDVMLLKEKLRLAIASKIREKYGQIAYNHFIDTNRIYSNNVIYEESLSASSVNLFLGSFDECKQKYWHKLKDWSYEQEYRIGVSLGGRIAVKIPNIVKHIYLGCNSTMEQIAKIYRLTKKNKLNIPISIMNKTALGLEPMRLSKETLDDIDEKYGHESMTFWDEYENTYKKINNINNE